MVELINAWKAVKMDDAHWLVHHCIDPWQIMSHRWLAQCSSTSGHIIGNGSISFVRWWPEEWLTMFRHGFRGRTEVTDEKWEMNFWRLWHDLKSAVPIFIKRNRLLIKSFVLTASQVDCHRALIVPLFLFAVAGYERRNLLERSQLQHICEVVSWFTKRSCCCIVFAR